jgi:hypothetical protein
VLHTLTIDTLLLSFLAIGGNLVGEVVLCFNKTGRFNILFRRAATTVYLKKLNAEHIGTFALYFPVTHFDIIHLTFSAISQWSYLLEESSSKMATLRADTKLSKDPRTFRLKDLS